jgi:hypothetical protein
MIPPSDCAAREDDPRDHEYDGYEPDWEDVAYDLAREREFEETVSGIHESKQQLQDYNKYTDRQLWRLSKQAKSDGRYLLSEYQFDVDADSSEVSLDGETYFTVSRDGREVERTLSRKDQRKMKKNRRKRARQLGILTKRGCSPRQVKGCEGGSFTTVVAAT